MKIFKTQKQTLCIASILTLLTSCSSVVVDTSAYEVKGVLLGYEDSKPIKGAQVTLLVSPPKKSQTCTTDDNGEFHLQSSGDSTIFPDLFLSEIETDIKPRKLKVSFTHPEFINEDFEDEIEYALTEPLVLDIGAYYLELKESEPK